MKKLRILFPFAIILLFADCDTNLNQVTQTGAKKYPYTDTVRLTLNWETANIPVDYYARHITKDSSVFIGSKAFLVDNKTWNLVSMDKTLLASDR